MTRLILIAAPALAAIMASSWLVLGHGASVGIHLHLEPNPASPGAEISAVVDSEWPLSSVQVAFVDEVPVEVRPEQPSRRIVISLRVPVHAKGETLSAHVEARTTSGKTIRASTILRIREP